MKLPLLLIIVFSFIPVNAQVNSEYPIEAKLADFVPPSPTASELGKYGDIPLNESTGLATIDIPLYSYSTKNLSVPISMSYTTSGIKVDQVSSWVGLGWNLNAGGVINRTIRGLADEKANIREFPSSAYIQNLKTSNPTAYYTFIDNVNNENGYDYMPDFFNYSVNGQSGRFFLDENMKPVLVKKDNETTIDVIGSTINNGFVITSPDGIKYYFGENSAQETTKQTAIKSTGGNNGFAEFEKTAWYLTRIRHYNGDEIYFEYGGSTSYSYLTSLSQIYGKNDDTEGKPQEASLPPEGETKISNVLYVNGKILSRISSNRNNVEINFNSGGSRPDVDDVKLNSLVIKYQGQTGIIKKFDFTYDYITSNKNYVNASAWPSVSVSNNNKRMFLNNIKEIDTNLSSVDGKQYSFYYESPQDLPPRLYLGQDYLGFYNGKSNYGYVPNTCNYNGLFTNDIRGDRSYSFSHAEKGILKKVVYPTSGFTEIDYELGYSGIRVKRIMKKSSDIATPEVIRYYYATKENASPSYPNSFLPIGSGDCISINPARVNYTWQFNGNTYSDQYQFTRVELVSKGNLPLYMTSSDVYMYSTVTKSYGENFENGGVEKQFIKNTDLGANQIYGQTIFNGYRSNSAILNGTILKETVFTKVNNLVDIKKETVYQYETDVSQNVVIDSYFGRIRYETYENNSDGSLKVLGYDVNNIKTQSLWHSVKSISTTEHHDTSNITSSTLYGYSSGLAGLPSTIESTNSNNTTTFTNIYYVSDVNSLYDLSYQSLTSNELNAIHDLKKHNSYNPNRQHRVAKPIQIETLVKNSNNEVLSRMVKRTDYKNWGDGIIEPYKISLLKGEYHSTTNKLNSTIEYHSYDSQGNPIEISQTNGPITCYIWGYNKQHPIAKIENAIFSDIPTSVLNAIISASDLDTSSSTESLLRTELEKLRSPSYCPNLTTAMVTTYTYDPLIGVTSITDPRGQTVYYEYDDFNRLKRVIDNDQKILSENQYHYANQN